MYIYIYRERERERERDELAFSTTDQPVGCSTQVNPSSLAFCADFPILAQHLIHSVQEWFHTSAEVDVHLGSPGDGSNGFEHPSRCTRGFCHSDPIHHRRRRFRRASNSVPGEVATCEERTGGANVQGTLRCFGLVVYGFAPMAFVEGEWEATP